MKPQFVAFLLSTLLLSPDVHCADGASAFVGAPPIVGIPPRPFRTRHPTTHRDAFRRRPAPSPRRRDGPPRLCSSSGSGFGKRPAEAAGPPSTPRELFELQELRAQLESILRQNIPYQTCSAEKREELAGYVEAVVERAESPIDPSGRAGSMGTARFVAGVEGKSWRMVFSTDGGGGGEGSAELPYGSTVVLRIGEFVGSEGRMDYVLKFNDRVMGLNELVAKSSCSVDTSPVNPGLFTFRYEDIKTNAFGLSNLPIGFFGLLKGRVNCIDTVWFDGERWIERNYLENGDMVYSVYVRDVEDEKEFSKKKN